MIIGCIRTGLAEHTHAELYKIDLENISSNNFLSALGRALRKSFHSAYSMLLAIRNDGIVLPKSILSKYIFHKYLITKNVVDMHLKWDLRCARQRVNN
jgi:hypothetical protein